MFADKATVRMEEDLSSTTKARTTTQKGAEEQETELLTCAFNQDGGCLAVGTTTGFAVHNLYPSYAKTVSRQLQGGIGTVEMLYRCNLMALVGGGPTPKAPPHRVLIWDDHIPKEIGELSFRQVVLSVKLRKDAIAVALRDRVYIYNLADLSLRDKIYTADNPHGLLCLSTQIQDMVLACPSVTPGHVRVELYGLRKTSLMEAHEGALRGMALTADGSKLATASTKGTVIRVWNVTTASCIQEFRRGVERATVTCLAWSWDSSYLCCTSDKGTAHIFQLEQDSKNSNDGKNSNGGSSPSSNTAANSVKSTAESYTQMFFSTVMKTVEGGDAKKKSVCQIRGVPHPLACSFVADAGTSTPLVAVAGWDADGNGVLLLSEFAPHQEPRRVGYHVVCQSATASSAAACLNGGNPSETEEARRRRRLRGWTPEIPQTPEGGRLYVGERLEILENNAMDQIVFEETNDADEFVSVSTIPRKQEEPLGDIDQRRRQQQAESPTTAVDDKDSRATIGSDERDKKAAQDHDAGCDSIRTEPLDDDEINSNMDSPLSKNKPRVEPSESQ